MCWHCSARRNRWAALRRISGIALQRHEPNLDYEGKIAPVWSVSQL